MFQHVFTYYKLDVCILFSNLYTPVIKISRYTNTYEIYTSKAWYFDISHIPTSVKDSQWRPRFFRPGNTSGYDELLSQLHDWTMDIHAHFYATWMHHVKKQFSKGKRKQRSSSKWVKFHEIFSVLEFRT